MLNKDNLDFHPKYVEPFYIRLIGFGFMQNNNAESCVLFLNSIKELRKDLSNDEVLNLLNSNWRPSKVGAWLIGLCKISELKKELIEYLKNQPIYCEHAIINLAIFNTEDANRAIKDHLVNQLQNMLDYSLKKEGYNAFKIYDQNSISWGIGAIKYLDSLNSTNDFEVLISSEVWSSLKNYWSIAGKKNDRSSGFLNVLEELENVDMGFEKAMGIISKVIDLSEEN